MLVPLGENNCSTIHYHFSSHPFSKMMLDLLEPFTLHVQENLCFKCGGLEQSNEVYIVVCYLAEDQGMGNQNMANSDPSKRNIAIY